VSNISSLLETSEKFREALFANDVTALDLLMADEYVGYDPLGNPQDKAMSLEAYQEGGAKLDKYEVEALEAKVIGGVGIVTGKGYIHGIFADAEFEHDLRFLDLYIHREGRWQLFLSQVTPLG
jgi:hypothetical protein